MGRSQKIVVGFSGGVDSLVAARLLLEQGCEVVPLFLEMGGEGAGERRRRARRAAAGLGLKLLVENLSAEFSREVVDYLVASYRRGETPNPCLHCNARIKFAGLAAAADRLGIETLATGHYCRRPPASRAGGLLRAVDRSKDQSYFLLQVPAAILRRTRFPLGELSKRGVLEMAALSGWRSEGYRESQELCFLNGGDYRDFLRRRDAAASRPGDIVTLDGEVVGRHRGLENYTVGQRRGLDIAWSEPLYVLRLDCRGNRLFVGPRAAADRRVFRVRELNWLGPEPAVGRELLCQIRHRHRPAPVRIAAAAADFLEVVFAVPQFAVAPGQGAAFYHDDRLLGGGIIETGTV